MTPPGISHLTLLTALLAMACRLPVEPHPVAEPTGPQAESDSAATAITDGGVLEGVVLRGELRRGLPGAVVLIEGTGQFAITDSSGAFRIQGLKGGVHAIVVRHPSYPEVRSPPVRQPDGGKLTFDVSISSAPPQPPAPIDPNVWMVACGLRMLVVTEPILVVDGVIQAGDMGPKLDLAELNVSSIEIFRGVHATSLFGQRAALGVVAIHTRRTGS